MKAGAGAPVTTTGKTSIRSTMTPVFGKRAGKRSAAKRSGSRGSR